jgi:hypothetical protein
LSAIRSEIVPLDGDGLRGLSDSALCRQDACAAERLQSPAPFFGFSRPKAERAAAALDEELLDLFQGAAMQRSNVEGLFWRIGSPITDD